jgi:hypothetical protein
MVRLRPYVIALVAASLPSLADARQTAPSGGSPKAVRYKFRT